MSPVELIALSLIVSIAVAALGRWVAGVLDRRLGEARLRDRLWAGVLLLPLIPPVAVGLLLLTPAPQRPAVIVTPAPIYTPVPVEIAASEIAPVSAPTIRLDPVVAAWALLAFAGLATVWRGGGLMFRGRRLARLLVRSGPASPEARRRVETEARALGVRAPETRAGATGGDVLLAGAWRPTLILPPGLEDEGAFDLIVRHELSHLKRGDHRAVWLEEALLIGLAFNPFVSGLRARRAAAREEACDVMALNGAAPAARRAYARRLIEILKADTFAAPALSFGGGRKSQTPGETTMKTPTMRRMAAILTPPAPAGRSVRLGALGAGLLMLTAAGAASAAVVLQREATASLVLTEGAGPDWSRDADWSQAALAPVYRAVWPNACGFSQNPDGITIHLGEGCAGPDVPDARVTGLAGVDPVRDPRGAFRAVEAACVAHRPVALAWTENGVEKSARVACAAPAVAPIPPKEVEIALTFDGLDAPRPGDRLEVVLERQVGDNRHAKSLEFNLGGASVLPREVRGQAPQDLFADGAAPKLLARLIGADGVVRARTTARSKPMIVSRDRAIAFADLEAVKSSPPTSGRSSSAQSGEDAARQAVQSAASALTPEQEARFRRATGEDYKAMCLSGDPVNEGFCSGVMFAALDVPGSSVRVCVPTETDGQINAVTAVNRGKAMMSTIAVQPGLTPREVARIALATAWPCRTAETAAPAGAVRVPVRLDVDRFPALTRGEVLTVSLWVGEARGAGLTLLTSRQVRADSSGRFPDTIDMPLAPDLFPRFGQPARAYHLSAEVQAANGDSLYGAEPTTLRLAAMGQGAARRLRPELTFRRSGFIGGPDPYPWAT